MKLSFRFLLISLLNIILITQVYAALNLQLTQGIKSRIPITINNFVGQPNSATNIADIVRQDLQNSGEFAVSNQNMLISSPKTIDWKTWQRQRVSNLVIGQIQARGNQYQIKVYLLNPFAETSHKITLAETFTVNKNLFRKVAHKISDAIYQNLIGQKGIFSTRIAYILVSGNQVNHKQYRLIVADYDGFQPRTLVLSSAPLMSPAWSPNGREIAYVSLDHDQAKIYIVNVASGAQTLVSAAPGINGAPAWSPNGKKLALVLSKTGYAKIYIENLANRQLTQLTNGFSIDTEPNWSPDGKSLVFTSNRGGSPQIYQMNLANKQIQRLTYDGDYNTTASFTPDGKKLAVLHRSDDNYNIAVQDLASGGLQIVTQNGYCSSPAIAPNGHMILYAQNKNFNSELGMVSIDGQIQLQLPSPEGSVQEPTWSPFLH